MNHLTDQYAFEAALNFLCERDELLGKVIKASKPKPIRAREFTFSSVVSTIIDKPGTGSQARAVFKRIRSACGGSINAIKLSEITDQKLNELGLSQSKVAHIRSLQSKVIADRHYLRNIRNLEHDRAAIALKQIEGIGSWEAKIILLYYFYSENVFVYDDALLDKAIRHLYDPDPNHYAGIIERWHPYKSVACICLWRWMDKFGTKLLGAEP